MLGWAFIVLIGALLALAFVLVVLNRQSQEVVNAAVPVAVGALAALTLAFSFAQHAPVSQLFPAQLFMQQSDNYPMLVPLRPTSFGTLALFDEAVRSTPVILEGVASPSDEIYDDFIQAAILDWITAVTDVQNSADECLARAQASRDNAGGCLPVPPGKSIRPRMSGSATS
jgi:hypothetical protein